VLSQWSKRVVSYSESFWLLVASRFVLEGVHLLLENTDIGHRQGQAPMFG
jgi:hypothetical protein